MCLEITKDTKDTKGLEDWKMWGVAPRPGRGGALCAPENGEQRTENGAPRWGDKEIAEQRNQTSKPPNFQTSNCPCTRRHVCDVPEDGAMPHRRYRRFRRYRNAPAGRRWGRVCWWMEMNLAERYVKRRSARDGHGSEAIGRTVKCPGSCATLCLRGKGWPVSGEQV